MTLRTQLALTFLALTILPLGGLAGYSYYSSSNAVRSALEQEAADLAKEIDGKLAATRRWVAGTVRNVEPIALENLIQEQQGSGHQVARKIIRDMGSAATLVRSLEFIPSPEMQITQSAHGPAGVHAGTAPAASSAEAMEPPAAIEAVPPTPPAPGVASVSPPPAPPASPVMPNVVIDIQDALAEVRAEAGRGEKTELGEGSLDLALQVVESIPIEAILQQSLKSVQFQLEAAEAAMEVETDERADADLESDRKELEATRKEIEVRLSQIQERRESQQPLPRPSPSRQSASSRRSEEPENRPIHARSPAPPAIPVVQDGEIVGAVTADVHDEEILRNIFLTTAAQGDEIPFAIDSSGKLYTRSDEHEATLRELDVPALVAEVPDSSRFVQKDWIIATSRDPNSGLLIGVIRPAADAIAEVRRATLRSLGLGIALVGICLIGVLPLANHMTRDISAVTAGAERISHGELDAEVRVRSRNEVGRLAEAFNRMSSELRTNQRRLVEEEAARREQEIREQLLKEEYDRTAHELEEARQFQLSMLPASLPRVSGLEIAVEMETATEVGGDYYDFHEDERGLTIALGDGTGHGAKAGTMVAVIKSLFTALRSADLRAFLKDASATIRSMQLGRMSMALTLLRIEHGQLRVAAAGMPPILVCRAPDGAVEEIAMPGAPLGTIDFPYEEQITPLSPGDLVVAMSDGLPELLDPDGEPFGYERIVEIIHERRHETPEALIATLQQHAERWRRTRPQNDDMTLLILKSLG